MFGADWGFRWRGIVLVWEMFGADLGFRCWTLFNGNSHDMAKDERECSWRNHIAKQRIEHNALMLLVHIPLSVYNFHTTWICIALDAYKTHENGVLIPFFVGVLILSSWVKVVYLRMKAMVQQDARKFLLTRLWFLRIRSEQRHEILGPRSWSTTVRCSLEGLWSMILGNAQVCKSTVPCFQPSQMMSIFTFYKTCQLAI